MWVEKHRPVNPSLMVGNEDARLGFLKWLKDWEMGDKPALLVGPPGVGKTTLVHAAAKFLGYFAVELNASDVRTKSELKRKLGSSLGSTSLTGEKTLLFLDEVDGLHGIQDHGGIDFVEELVAGSRVPVVMSANSEDEQKMRTLFSKSQVFRFKRITPRLVEMYVREILRRESKDLSDDEIEKLVKQSGGDVRAVVNTAQTLIGLPSNLRSASLVKRGEDHSAKESYGLFFSSRNVDEAYEVLRNMNALPREKIRAIHTSLVTSKLDPKLFSSALHELSLADQIIGKINRTQGWRLLRYFDRLLAHGLIEAIRSGNLSYSEDDLSWPMKLRIWNESRFIRQIASALAKGLHISTREALDSSYPYLVCIAARSKENLEKIQKSLNLDESAVKMLRKEADRVLERSR